MHSRTKAPVPTPVVTGLVEHHLGAPVAGVDELADGTYNAAYRVALADGAQVVVKVAPPDDLPRLAYEHALMRSEVSYYARAAGRAPVPAVLAEDFTRRLIDRDVIVLSFLDGAPLQRIGSDLTPQGLTAVRAELGTAVARLHEVRGESFGYDRPGDRDSLRGDTWSEAFSRIWDAAVSDIVRYRVRIGPSEELLRSTVRRHSALLDEVSEPTLVHFDLWDGNVFAAHDGDAARLTGLIDGERMFWGDPLAELVSTSLFREPAEDVAFNVAYARAGGREWTFDEDQRTRLALYDAYLCMLMLAEAVPRGYRGMDAVMSQRFIRRRLRTTLRRLHS
ncbi:aminoglycoside phosphotransferase family protein [Microbacterium sp. SSW1-49]|uniref:Aminoglycoside phosphotransferase family protein n=1 Tax=Microbacterium croceum TaxID=2851645 RepID=A0ABT0FJA5_9MICO|nr:aminoglycoside phosphotransferase family protein [Microbacterium croceum]MCK2037891.1 aminoglycoside phosphotransferase family protein [Microbacterium croceum]